MSVLNRIIYNSIDKTLDRLSFIDKKEFLSILTTQYGIKPSNIAEKFDDFHTALKSTL